MLPPDRMIAAIVTAAIAILLFWRFLARTSQLSHLRGRASVADGQLIPEGLYAISITDAAVSYEHPNGTIQSIAWDELRRVEIVTTDEGPFLPDSFWVLTGEKNQCIIAQGAKGESLLLERLQSLPEFDNEALISAIGSTSNERFLCWDRDRYPR